MFRTVAFVSLLPAFLPSLWVWLYASSGLVLKVARRFDLGFDWFKRHLDVEKKPLQSLGLVSGVLVSLTYWTIALVSRIPYR